MSVSRPRRRWWALVALCAAVNLAEWGSLRLSAPSAQPVLAPQASAVAPFGAFHDLRWISVSHNSWWSFGLEMLAMLVVRGGLVALSVSLAWPEGMTPGPLRALLGRGVMSTAAAAVLLAPSVALLFGLAVVPISWLFLAAVPAAILVALVIHPLAVSSEWWRRAVPLRALGWVALSFVVLSAAGPATRAGAPWTGAPVAVLCGFFNAWAWTGVVHALVDRRPAGRAVPVVPAALALLIGVTIGGAVLGFVHAPHPSASPAQAPPLLGRGQPVLVVSGYGSTFDGAGGPTIPGPFAERRFSYRGLAADGRPLPYGSVDTVKPLAQLDRMMAAQIEALASATGRRVDVVAESEGSLVAKTTLLARPDLPVSVLVLASPLREPGRLTYPLDGRGWGGAAGVVMSLLGHAFQAVAPIDLSPDSAFLASVDAQASAVRGAMTCPLAGVRQFALLPLADATAAPEGPWNVPSVVVSAFHGGLLADRADQQLVSRVLLGRPVTSDPVLEAAESVIGSAAAPWQVPALTPPPASCAAAARTLARSAFG